MEKTTRTCSIAGCERRYAARGWCKMHYYRWKRTGNTEPPSTLRPVRLCSVSDCEKKHAGNGYCQMHASRLKKYGSLDLPPQSPRTCGLEGCDLPYRSKGYCAMHYQRWITVGDPGPVDRFLFPAGLTCSRAGCTTPAKSRGVCSMHSRHDRIIAEVARNPARRIHTWATNEERLRRIGWTESVVRPDLDACWEWDGDRDKRGYGRISVQGRKMRFAHRIAYQTWNGDLEDGLLVCHRCDNPPCMNPAHLFQGDQFANMGDAVSKKRHAYGERQGQHKLTERQVVQIRSDYAAKLGTYKDFGSLYGVSAGAIRYIINGRNWKHLL